MGAGPASTGPLRLRPMPVSDLGFVSTVEDDPANRPFITPWERTQHEGQVLYASEGFLEEGRLRQSVRVRLDGADGYDSQVVMSMLDREHQARIALGQDEPR